MGLILAAALLQAFLFLLFKVFDKRRIPLMPSIAVNYVIAAALGTAYAQPWKAADLAGLWWPSLAIGILFVGVFFLTGRTAQRAGVAASTVASKMSLVLTVLFAVVMYHEEPGITGWSGLAFAVVGVLLGASTKSAPGQRIEWKLPFVLFIGTAAIDISINAVQRFLLVPDTEAVFPTLALAVAGMLSMAMVIGGEGARSFNIPAVWIGGALLGVFNYGTLLFVVRALAQSGLPASRVFPLISIGVILIGTLGSVVLFRETVNTLQRIGIGFAVIALLLLYTSKG
ncbi:MAG: EamA family transporter [Flavobacteriales bacterium]|nr:EamA family transporter [Flavobacteriales bacterium]